MDVVANAVERDGAVPKWVGCGQCCQSMQGVRSGPATSLIFDISLCRLIQAAAISSLTPIPALSSWPRPFPHLADQPATKLVVLREPPAPSSCACTQDRRTADLRCAGDTPS